jgi:hypothetical protein
MEFVRLAGAVMANHPFCGKVASVCVQEPLLQNPGRFVRTSRVQHALQSLVVPWRRRSTRRAATGVFRSARIFYVGAWYRPAAGATEHSQTALECSCLQWGLSELSSTPRDLAAGDVLGDVRGSSMAPAKRVRWRPCGSSKARTALRARAAVCRNVYQVHHV